MSTTYQIYVCALIAVAAFAGFWIGYSVANKQNEQVDLDELARMKRNVSAEVGKSLRLAEETLAILRRRNRE